jgi:uncharacterized protein with PIN domain
MSPPDEKDRLGQKLRDVEKAREDQWAAQQDRELIEKLRRKGGAQKRQMKCPECGQPLETTTRNKVSMALCSAHGAWLEKAALDALLGETRDTQ